MKVKRSKIWKKIVDLTTIRRGGISATDLLVALKTRQHAHAKHARAS